MSDSLVKALARKLQTRERESMPLSGRLGAFRRAAVLVPLLRTPEGLGLLFTVRSQGLSNHAGQTAFPGGRVDAGESASEAARREMWEEVGIEIPPKAILGPLDDQPSPAGYVVTPVVAVIPWPQVVTLNPVEVEEVFTLSLSDLQRLSPRSEERTLEGLRRRIYFYAHEERLVWGMTGNILRNLLELMPGIPDGEPEDEVVGAGET